MHALLALLLLAEPRLPTHAVWFEPVALIYSATYAHHGYLLDTPQIYGLGGQLAVTPTLAVTLQLSAVSPSMIKSESIVSPAYLVTGSPGLLGLVMGPEPLKGFIVQVRVAYSYGQAWQRAAISRSQVILSEAMAIVDLGVQWRWRRLYVAAVLGAGIGICVGCARGPEANAQEIEIGRASCRERVLASV